MTAKYPPLRHRHMGSLVTRRIGLYQLFRITAHCVCGWDDPHRHKTQGAALACHTRHRRDST